MAVPSSALEGLKMKAAEGPGSTMAVQALEMLSAQAWTRMVEAQKTREAPMCRPRSQLMACYSSL